MSPRGLQKGFRIRAFEYWFSTATTRPPNVFAWAGGCSLIKLTLTRGKFPHKAARCRNSCSVQGRSVMRAVEHQKWNMKSTRPWSMCAQNHPPIPQSSMQIACVPPKRPILHSEKYFYKCYGISKNFNFFRTSFQWLSSPFSYYYDIKSKKKNILVKPTGSYKMLIYFKRLLVIFKG